MRTVIRLLLANVLTLLRIGSCLSMAILYHCDRLKQHLVWPLVPMVGCSLSLFITSYDRGIMAAN